MTTRTAPVRIGLGIDAGGTYTDAAVVDLAQKRVCTKGKSLTTKWDFTIGISGALDMLPHDMLSRVDLVGISTTLATNAIVEGHGQTVGLLLMPPYGIYDPLQVKHDPIAVIEGRLDITGVEIAPVNTDEVRRAADSLIARGAGAFAVSGFAGTVNPAHELAVKDILRAHTGMSVTCGHELSGLLNFGTRAVTAVLNARIIPRLEKFLAEAERCLKDRGINAPIMVVKGDGTLMSTRAARERPVETVLSGPAASVAGARYITGVSDAIVLDMGGTTTDTAALTNGCVAIAEKGISVGGFKTHVRALAMSTIGLGGDSAISCEQRKLAIGPRRIVPISCAAAQYPRVSEALNYIEGTIDKYRSSTAGMDIVFSTGHTGDSAFTDEEKLMLSALADGPCTLPELAAKTGTEHWVFLDLRRLSEQHCIQFTGLTPTDLMHVTGAFRRWDTSSAERLTSMVASLIDQGRDEFITRVFRSMVESLAVEAMKKELDAVTDTDLLDSCPACRTFVDGMLSEGNAGHRISFTMKKPLVGIGAPVHHFLVPAAKLLGTNAVIPPDADVANAVGAVTSLVLITHTVVVSPGDTGGYAVEGVPGNRTFRDLDEASLFAAAALRESITATGKAAGAADAAVDISTNDRVSTDAGGRELFLGRVLTATLTGRPHGRGP